MSKVRDISGLANIIKTDANGNVTFVSGSTTLMAISSSGAITTTGVISGSNALSASYAATASFVALAQTASFVANAQSASNAVAAQTASFANAFTVANTLTAQTLVVQTITSSVDFVTGSTRFGSILGNTHLFTGSVSMTGSLAVVTNGTEFQVTSTGVNFGNALTDSHVISGSLRINPNGLFVSSSGDVGIGITDLGPTGLSLPATSNYAWSEGSGNAYAVLFRQRNSGATVIASGYKRSNTAGFASSFGTSMSRAAIAIGSNNGSIAFFSDSATNVANGTDITPTERMTITNAGSVGIGTTTPSSIFQVVSTQSLAAIRSTTTTNYAEVQIENTTNYLQVGVEGATGNRMGGTIAYNSYLGSYANYGMTFHTNNLNRMTITNNGYVGINQNSPTTQFQVRKNFWQFWVEKTHGSNVNLFSLTIPDFGGAVVTIAGSRYSPGADNYQMTAIFYIYITNSGAVSVTGGNTSGTWTPTTTVSSKTVTFSSAYAGSSTNYTGVSVVIQASGHNGTSESAASVALL